MQRRWRSTSWWCTGVHGVELSRLPSSCCAITFSSALLWKLLTFCWRAFRFALVIALLIWFVKCLHSSLCLATDSASARQGIFRSWSRWSRSFWMFSLFLVYWTSAGSSARGRSGLRLMRSCLTFLNRAALEGVPRKLAWTSTRTLDEL